MPKTTKSGATSNEEATQKTKESVQVIPEPSKEIDVIKPAEIVDNQIIFTPKHLELIKNQIAPNATNEEFDLFIMMSRRMRLDPLLRQLYFVKFGSNVSYITSIDSYRIIAHRTGFFAGVDLPKFDYDKGGKLTHCSITVYKLIESQKFGFSAKIKFSEYNTGNNQWASKPETMLAKVAEAHALRKAFPQDLNGVYTQDEMPERTIMDGNTGKVLAKKPVKKMITRVQAKEIVELLKEKEVDQKRAKAFVKGNFRVDSLGDITSVQANRMIKNLSELPDPEPADDFDSFVDSMPNDEPGLNEAMSEDAELDEIDKGIQAMQEI